MCLQVAEPKKRLKNSETCLRTCRKRARKPGFKQVLRKFDLVEFSLLVSLQSLQRAACNKYT